MATAAANVLATVLLGVAFVSVRNEASLARQRGGLELAGLAAIMAIGADLGYIVGTYRAVVTSRRHLSAMAVPITGAESCLQASTSRPVALPTGTLTHRAACSLVGGKNAEALAPEAIAGRRLRPCPVCRP